MKGIGACMEVDVQEYVLCYLKFETIGSEEDLKSIGVKEQSLISEKIRATEIADKLSVVIEDCDKTLRAQPAYARGVGEVGVRVQHFGPIVLAYIPQLNEESDKALYALMVIALPRIIRKMGRNGRFVRGSLVKGFGWVINEGRCSTLYGPIMHKAWHVLTEMAYSPRIIVEEQLFEKLEDRKAYGPGKDGDWLPLYLKRDYDGQGIFHYLAKDLEAPSIKSEGREQIIADMKETLSAIVLVTRNLSNRHFVHDNSESIRMSLALQDYVGNSICDWTNELRKNVMEEALRNAELRAKGKA